MIRVSRSRHGKPDALAGLVLMTSTPLKVAGGSEHTDPPYEAGGDSAGEGVMLCTVLAVGSSGNIALWRVETSARFLIGWQYG